MKYVILYTALILAAGLSACSTEKKELAQDKPLKEIFDGKFLMGVALNSKQFLGTDSVEKEQAIAHFNSIVAEDVMKCEKIHPTEKHYYWEDADRFVKLGEDNDMTIIGHCLIWHSQCAPWFFKDENGNPVDKETLKARICNHIHTIVGRYKGRIAGWDVVNEAIMSDGSFRESPFYQILGEEYIPLAFRCAHEADPEAELYLNDYGMNHPQKRDAYVSLINNLKSQGIKIDGIGMQSHMGMDYPDFNEYETSIKAFSSTGCKVMISELDMSALPTIVEGANIGDGNIAEADNPYTESLPDSISKIWNERMTEVFDILIRNSDVISRVTVWGLSDGDSWKNDWPVKGRTDYPLLLDRQYRLKPFVNKYIQETSL